MYATNSEQWGADHQNGKYPVKIYTIDGVLIYQADNGSGNTDTDTAPKGGVIYQSSASSMTATIANPITYYGSAVINQEGHSGDLYNYYWTSYSRGTDGRFVSGVGNEPKWHNVYLDGYIPLRVKSIYDPCPYLYRIPSNDTCNQFNMQTGWTNYSYLGGASWNLNTLGESWFFGLGRRETGSSIFAETGREGFYRSSTASSHINGYTFMFNAGTGIYPNHSYARSYGLSVRCIEGSLRSAFFSTVVDNNALGVQPILFCRKKYAKTPNTFSSAPL